MDSIFVKNAYNARWIIGTMVFGSMAFQKSFFHNKLVNEDVFGADGNGGHMLKIITNLTDEEMSRLKYVRRLAWHWKGTRQSMYGKETISDQEMADFGIELPKEKYVEYTKRPPHDKYL